MNELVGPFAGFFRKDGFRNCTDVAFGPLLAAIVFFRFQP